MTATAPVLAFGSDHPRDLLSNAASVLALLADLAPAMAREAGTPGLDEQAADGLSLLLMAVEATVGEALARI